MRRELANPAAEAASVGAPAFGLISLILCWWFPFGALVGAWGIGFAIAARMLGCGTNAYLGFLYSATGFSAAMILGWDSWSRLLFG